MSGMNDAASKKKNGSKIFTFEVAKSSKMVNLYY